MKYSDKKTRILLCDNHILVAYKPAGISTQADLKTQEGLDSYVKEWIKKSFCKRGNVFAHPIHRLDKPVSGLVLFARTSKALSRLQEMMREKMIQREYIAIIEASGIEEKEGLLEDVIYRKEHRALIASEKEKREIDPKEGKIAQLFYKVIDEKGCFTALSIQLITGRYHQIRAQLGSHFGPIVGDKKYGASQNVDKKKIYLHCQKLQFRHPVRDGIVDICIPPPFSL